MFRPFGVVLAFYLLVALLGPGPSLAQTVCVPEAFGVPALSGPPVWWTGGPEPQNWPRLDDPRWRGAYARSWGSGASEHVSFRALKKTEGGTPYLYLSWWVRVDPSLDINEDRLYVAFSPGGVAADVLIRVTPFDQTSTPLVAGSPASVSVSQRVMGAWSTVGTPLWITNTTRAWSDLGNQEWAINMRVPVAAGFNDGLNLDNDFRLWFSVNVKTPGGGLVPYTLGSLTYSDIATGTDASAWPQFNRSLALGSAGCARGISLAASDVGTKFVDSSGNPRPNQINANGVNTFFAQPMNDSGTSVPATAIQATFRIANWGTQPDWNVVPVAGSLWKQINSSPVTNPAAIPNATKASAAAGNELTFNWTLSATDRCEFLGAAGGPLCSDPPTRRLHQCMLVELSGGGFDYTPASVYRNMDFVDASNFKREAEVSVVGLPPIPGATRRPVYLYTKSYNMPAPGQPNPADIVRDLERLRVILKGDRETLAIIGNRAALDLPLRQEQATAARHPPMGVPFELMNQVFPTYVVHAYHDTGRTITVEGQTYRWLEPQTSFGYYVYHQGRTSGWDNALNGATQIAPNYYQLGVPEGGVANIETTVRAIQPGIGGFCASFRLASTGPAGGILAFIGLSLYWPRRRKGHKW